jgi:hypothetical protein
MRILLFTCLRGSRGGGAGLGGAGAFGCTQEGRGTRKEGGGEGERVGAGVGGGIGAG